MAIPLARSIDEPPPMAISPSQPASRYCAVALFYHRLGRVGRRLVEHGDGQAAGGIDGALREADGRHALVGDDHRPADADPRAFAVEFAKRAEAEMDVGEVEDEGHALSPGPSVLSCGRGSMDTLMIAK
ncbi:hypothetical protein ACEQUB_01582 [Ralstonia syzygii]